MHRYRRYRAVAQSPMHLDMELESGKGTVESQSGDKNSNIDRLRKSLMCLNVAAGVSRSDELVPTVLMYELDKNGKNSYKNMTLRDLLQYVLLDVNNELEVSTPARLDSAVGDLKLRDLRRLDFLFNPNEECAVLIRKHVVLVSLDPIRALVTTDKLLLIVPPGADTLLTMLEANLREELEVEPTEDAPLVGGKGAAEEKEADPPLESQLCHDLQTLRQAVAVEAFELHAYEALLTTLLHLECQQHHHLSAQLKHTLRRCTGVAMLPLAVQEQMRALKNALSKQLRRISDVRSTLTGLTEETEDMALMNLTALRHKPWLRQSPLRHEILSRHEIVEELLGAYVIDFAALEGKLLHERNQMQSAQDMLSVRLDTSQNQLLFADAWLGVLACTFALGAYITGLFGMNLDQSAPLERTPHSFVTAVLLSALFMLLLGAALMLLLLCRRDVLTGYSTLKLTDVRKLQ